MNSLKVILLIFRLVQLKAKHINAYIQVTVAIYNKVSLLNISL